jgi:hypothetical protein
VRTLQDLLKRVEKQTQVRRSGFEKVMAELAQHRDAAADPDLRSALTQLCNALTRFTKNPTPERSREVLLAANAAKQFPSAADPGQRTGRWRFWE